MAVFLYFALEYSALPCGYRKGQERSVFLKQNRSTGITDIVIFLLSILLLAGPQFIFPACGPKADGSWMICHQPQVIVTGIGAVLTFSGVLRLFCSSKYKRLLSLLTLVMAVVAMVMPGHVFPLCRLATMPCHAVFKPAVLFLGILLVLAAGLDLIIQRRNH